MGRPAAWRRASRARAAGRDRAAGPPRRARAAARVRQPEIPVARVLLFANPLSEAAPLPDQALVRDVDARIVGSRILSNDEEGTAALAEALQHRFDDAPRRAGFTFEPAQPHVAPHGAAVEVGVGQRLEDAGRQLTLRFAHPRQRGVGVARQRLPDAADGEVVRHVDRAVAAFPLPALPCAQQRMLHDRQLVLIVAEVVQQAVHQPRSDRLPEQADRPRDHLLAGRARQPGTRY